VTNRQGLDSEMQKKEEGSGFDIHQFESQPAVLETSEKSPLFSIVMGFVAKTGKGSTQLSL
jgi:hypothetical protein